MLKKIILISATLFFIFSTSTNAKTLWHVPDGAKVTICIVNNNDGYYKIVGIFLDGEEITCDQCGIDLKSKSGSGGHLVTVGTNVSKGFLNDKINKTTANIIVNLGACRNDESHSKGGTKTDLSFYEQWESENIDSALWHAWGEPKPIISSPGFKSKSSLDANGDGNEQSGVTSKSAFPLRRRCLSFDARIIGERSHWHHVYVCLTNGNLQSGQVESQYQYDNLFGLRINGQDEVAVYYITEGKNSFRDPIDHGWHRYAIKILNNNHVAFYRDGILRFTSTNPVDLDALPESYITINGRSEGGQVLVDNIRLE